MTTTLTAPTIIPTTIVFQNLDTCSGPLKSDLESTIRTRLESNGFPGGTVHFRVQRQEKAKGKGIGLRWIRHESPSEMVIIISKEMPNTAYRGYLVPQKNAKEILLEQDPGKRDFGLYVKEPTIQLLPKSRPDVAPFAIVEKSDEVSSSTVEAPSSFAASTSSQLAVLPSPATAVSVEKDSSQQSLVEEGGSSANTVVTELKDYTKADFENTALVDRLSQAFVLLWEQRQADTTRRAKSILPVEFATFFSQSNLCDKGYQLTYRSAGRALTVLLEMGQLSRSGKGIRKFYVLNKKKTSKSTRSSTLKAMTSLSLVDVASIQQVLNERDAITELERVFKARAAEVEAERDTLDTETKEALARLDSIKKRLELAIVMQQSCNEMEQDIAYRKQENDPLVAQIELLRDQLSRM